MSDVTNTQSVTPLEFKDLEQVQQSLYINQRKSGYRPKKDVVFEDSNHKKLYKSFVKIFLKIKFEKIDTNHPGKKIPEKVLFNECMKEEVPEDKFHDFILHELNNLEKYSSYVNKNINQKKVLKKPRNTKFLNKPLMETISEESF